jgi:uncharacterized protein YciW
MEDLHVSTVQTTDVIDGLLGLSPGSVAAKLRDAKPEYREDLQNYYLSIFEPDAESAAAFSVADRGVVAVRVASHTGSTAAADFYADVARTAGADDATITRARNVATQWTDETVLGAAIRRADRVTTEPITTKPEHIRELENAGLSSAGILSLSQVIAFVSYQVRLIAGLRAFGV